MSVSGSFQFMMPLVEKKQKNIVMCNEQQRPLKDATNIKKRFLTYKKHLWLSVVKVVSINFCNGSDSDDGLQPVKILASRHESGSHAQFCCWFLCLNHNRVVEKKIMVQWVIPLDSSCLSHLLGASFFFFFFFLRFKMFIMVLTCLIKNVEVRTNSTVSCLIRLGLMLLLLTVTLAHKIVIINYFIRS